MTRHLRNYSTLIQSQIKLTMDPWFITGFVDGEGCFSISIIRSKERKVGWRVQPSFQIGLHQKDKALLEQMKNFFGDVGSITKQGSELFQYRVQSIKDLQKIIEHFAEGKYPLITNKTPDYLLFKRAVHLIKNREHLTQEGLLKIVSLKASLNWGISDELKTAFPDLLPVPRPSVVDQEIKDPNWLAGFTDAEGCFRVIIKNSKTSNLGEAVQLIFQLTQHSKDIALMQSLIKYWDCGNVFEKSKQPPIIDFRITKFEDLYYKVIPFFQKYPLYGVKRLDYLDWCKIAELMKSKAHLTQEGLEEIRKIKSRMNTGRKFD